MPVRYFFWGYFFLLLSQYKKEKVTEKLMPIQYNNKSNLGNNKKEDEEPKPLKR